MKKWLIAVSAVPFLLLGGCSSLEGVNNTLTYVNEATDYVNEASTFANEIPTLAEQAVSDQQAAQELETKLQEMKQDIEEFNGLQPPDMAADLHQQIVEQNNQVVQGIDLYLNNVEEGKLDPALLENTEIFQSIQEITSIIDQIKELGQ
ncbi:TolA-binding protein [Bacillus fengqiuensis]|nr:TolA-binding protein [Bacillus fengqiuensis]